MTKSRNLLDELDGLIKRAGAKKAEELEKAEQEEQAGNGEEKTAGETSRKMDNEDDNTTAATTGEQAAANKRDNRDHYSAGSTDKGAETNPSGEAVDMSSDMADAVDSDGQEGPEPGHVAEGGVGSEGPQGPGEETDVPNKAGWDSGAFAGVKKRASELSEELRKIARGYKHKGKDGDYEGDYEEGSKGKKHNPGYHKKGSSELNPLQEFLVKSARVSEDPQVKAAADAVEDDAALAGAASDAIMQGIEAGEIGDEEAAQILEEAVQAGAVSEEELAEAAEMVQAATAEGGGEMAGAGEADLGGAEMAGGEMAGGAMDYEALPEEKLAFAEVGPESEHYVKKLASLYPDEMNAGYAFGLKLAQELSELAEKETGDEGDYEEKEEREEKGDYEEGNGEDENGGEEAPPADAVPPPAEAAPPAAPEEVAPIGAEDYAPQSPEEEQALQAVQEELGLDDAALAQIMAAPVPGELDKVASAKSKYRSLILNKVAASWQ